MDLPKKFSYAGRWPALLGFFAFFGIGTILFTQQARTATSWSAGPYWALAILSTACMLLPVYLSFRWIFFGPPLLELGQEAVVVPCGFLHGKTWRVRYEDIFAISEEKTREGTVLILHGSHSFARINASLLRNHDTYVLIKNFLSMRADNARQHTTRATSPDPNAPVFELFVGDAKVVGSSRVDLQACKLEYSIVSPK